MNGIARIMCHLTLHHGIQQKKKKKKRMRKDRENRKNRKENTALELYLQVGDERWEDVAIR